MDFADSIRAHARQVADKRGFAETEEAAKTSLILPFLQALGYNPFDPQVVVPEYCADFGDKKACKVDYAIKRGGDVVIIVEAKKAGDPLDGSRESQLQKYFQSLLSVKIAVLTDGIVYKFFTDLENPNVMDKKPFMTFDFANMDEALIPELKKLCNDCFDLDTALCAAQELKYLGQLKRLAATELEKPSDDFVKLFARQVYDGKLMGGVVEDFRPRVKLAFENHINDVLNARLKSAIQPNAYPGVAEEGAATEEAGEPVVLYGNVQGNGIETTREEIEGFHIVRAIVGDIVKPEDVIMKDAVSYCGILHQGNVRRPICRLHFNNVDNLQIETFNTGQASAKGTKKGDRHKIGKLTDMYQYAPLFRQAVAAYLSPVAQADAEGD